MNAAHLARLLLFWLCCAGANAGAVIPGDAATVADTVYQNFTYEAENAGEVFLVWKPVNYPVTDGLNWNEDTRAEDSLLYTPMVGEDGRFSATLKLPVSAEFYFCFWITENDAGDIRDYWDVRVGATVAATPDRTIHRVGTVEGEEVSGVGIRDLYMILFGLLLVVYVVLRWAGRQRLRDRGVPAIHRILALGGALALLHLIARAEILGVTPHAALTNPRWTVVTVWAASLQDLLLVAGLVLLGWAAVAAARSRSQERWITAGFTVVTLLLAFTSQVNVDTVAYMGNPFTYQWLYYSEFLTATDAWSAIGEQASGGRVGELLAACLGVLVLSRIMELVLLWLPVRLGTLLLAGGLATAVIGSALLAHHRPPQAMAGQLGNAVTTFVGSVISSDAPSAFSEATLPAGALPFAESEYPLAAPMSLPDTTGRVRNLLFIVLESAGAVYFNTYTGQRGLEEPLQPYLDQSLVFEEVYAHAPSTNCSLVSLLTGIYPKLSYESVTKELTTVDFPSVPSILSERGYRTSFFSSADQSWQSGMEYLQHRGFDIVKDYRNIECEEQFRVDLNNYKEGGGIDDACLAEQFNNWVGEDTTTPFFSVLWTVQAHYPYYFKGEEHDYGVGNFSLNRYLNAVRHGTEVVDRVLQDLRRRGLDSTTLVVVTGDHGEAFQQHGHSGHGNTLYEEDLRVPLYFINPVLFDGRRYDGLAATKDIPATALSLLGVEVPEAWQGRKLLASRSDEVFFFAPWTQLYFGYRKGNTKYIFNETKNSVEVYDLAADPYEKRDLSATVPEAAIDSARIRIAAWVQSQSKLYDSFQ
ncbi:LTA synthase family protein [Neolewinella litorea]|uniref:Sulfatase N-terminal domain-containing protein n=1 Tax=Neolewinella litorea TaxID=2562452 RepID=A0A4S4NMK6_9BACT|nr:sulfatase-like hydrolase/transferase [Neolewinella litorea]THH41169.1 hypothetical protein E4021_00805 [Neolewinella litorea]